MLHLRNCQHDKMDFDTTAEEVYSCTQSFMVHENYVRKWETKCNQQTNMLLLGGMEMVVKHPK